MHMLMAIVHGLLANRWRRYLLHCAIYHANEGVAHVATLKLTGVGILRKFDPGQSTVIPGNI